LNITARSDARKKDFFVDKAIKEAAAIQLLPGFGRTRALRAWSGKILSTRSPGSSEPLPLTDLAYRVLRKWKEESGLDSPYIFPSPQTPGRPIGSVKTTWKATLRRAGVPHFPTYDLRHAFCTRLSWVAPDAIIQRAMRHTSPETKRRYQLGMVEQVREAMEKTNQQVDGKHVTVQ